MKSTIDVYLLTYDRPDFVKKALQSILIQDYETFKVILSDNSSNDETRNIYQDFSHSKFEYRRRSPQLPPLEHFSTCISEASAEFLVLFHDDDIMLPSYLRKLANEIEKDNKIAAVGSNAYYMYDDKESHKTVFSQKENIEFKRNEAAVFAVNYLLFNALAPFPTYIYRTDMVKGLRLKPSQGGKHSDVSFLMDVLSIGAMKVLKEPLIYYRIHNKQDSQKNNIYDRLSLLRHICSHAEIYRRSEAAMNYRRIAWCDWLKLNWRESISKHHRRYFKIFRIMLPYLIRNKFKQPFGNH